MAIKYIPYYPNTLEGQALLDNFVRTRRMLSYRDNNVMVEHIQRGMPLYEVQQVEHVGAESNRNMLLRGECLSACAYLKEQGIEVDLVYIDPPFASGADYAKKVYVRRNPKVAEAIQQAESELDVEELKAFEEKMYGDVWDKERYLNWMYENLMAIKSVMSERASIYVHQALEDVNFYNSRLRKMEINDILPIIEQDRYKAIRSQRNWLFVTTGLVVAILLAILWSYFVIRRKNQKLTEARETIAGQLELLQQANHRLKEDDKIKNAYIGRSFYTNAEYIAKLEKLYLTISRKIQARQFEDLMLMTRQSTLNAERENMYEAFDGTFLKIFPTFVERFNELFEEKDRKLPANDHSLTSEMRIFALIRLGINDSDRIAKFLDYSVHTVNTYKTRVKNRSTVENDEFERRVMEI